MALKIKGVYPPIATPFDADGEVSVTGLSSNIAKLGKTGISGLVVLGSNGEFPYLDDYERDVMVETAVEVAPEHFQIIVGTGRESTRATIRTTSRAASMGASAAIVINPCYYTSRMTDQVLYDHYRAVAEESPIPILVYNAPGFTGVSISSRLVARMAELPNIVGVKDTSGNIVQIAETVSLTSNDFAVLAGSASFLLASLAVGAVGGVLALSNIAPDECVELVRLFEQGEMGEARALQHRVLPVNAAITSRFGASGLKAAMELRGYYGGLPRRPLLPLKPAEREEIMTILRDAALIA